jgi:hypothetical protein
MKKIYVLTYNGTYGTFVEAYSTTDKMRKRIEELLDEASMFYETTITNTEELADYAEDYITWHEAELDK